MNEGRVIPYSRLIEYAWGYYDEGDSNLLKTHICHIRKKLGLSPTARVASRPSWAWATACRGAKPQLPRGKGKGARLRACALSFLTLTGRFTR